MSRKASLEATISLASEIKNDVKALCAIYAGLPRIIEREHLAIQNRSINAQESAAREKTIAGEEVEKILGELNGRTRHLAILHAQVCENRNEQPRTIGTCVKLLKELETVFAKDAMGSAVLAHLIHGIEESLAKFKETHAKVGPVIETNRYVMQRLLRNQQENVRFWQRLQDEALSTYSPPRVAKKTSSPTLLNVRA